MMTDSTQGGFLESSQPERQTGETISIHVVNNSGGGFAERKQIRVGQTVGGLFSEVSGGDSPEHFLIRVNREPTSGDYVLKQDDRVSITPTKIEGQTD